uniref:Matrix metalloproteinase-14-like n=1 Tax=Petromyzon marinus TaxID=7757 RepID=A0AAJ7UEL6_PETMA|nr:matrix metalloproteinase-14-like [Petromyzon marinus]
MRLQAPSALSALLLSLLAAAIATVEEAPGESVSNRSFSGESWLERYGYLPAKGAGLGTYRSAETLSSAVAAMQQLYGIPVTGDMDELTLRWMKRPRCGVPDRISRGGGDAAAAGSTRRRKRFAVNGLKWSHRHITYNIHNYTPKVGEYETRQAIRQAFDIWQTVTPLTFHEAAGHEVDINIFFASGQHGDNSPFDGVGGFLAHAYFPGPGIGGDTHFDDDEPWTIGDRDYTGNDLFIVAVHELGHALGLEHSNDPTAVMAPFYQYMDTEDFRLPYDDLLGIQQIYGPPDAPPTVAPHKPKPPSKPEKPRDPKPPKTKPERKPPHHPRHPAPPRAPPRPGSEPDICAGKFDTLARLRGELVVFKDEWFWRVRDGVVLSGYPMPIGHFWQGLPHSVDTVYERPDGKFVFFKGSKFWLFQEGTSEPGFPRQLKELGRGLPRDRVDAAVWWESTSTTYFFRGDRYWRFDEDSRAVAEGYPKPLSLWEGVPSGTQAAFLSQDGVHTFFVKGDRYWKFNIDKKRVESGFPRSLLRDWMGCDGGGGGGGRGTDGDDDDDGREEEEDEEEEEEAADEDEEGEVVEEMDRGLNPLVFVLPCLLLLGALAGAVVVLAVRRRNAAKPLRYCQRSIRQWV